jgi:2-succinyl-6-hydroxy-2,4-cyclohexadiene-1-carboxylate synthase
MPIIDITIGEKASKGKWLYHYIERGSGEPLLLFHGFTGSIENWQRQIDILAEHYRVFAIDLPGHGQTKVTNDATLHSIPFVIKDIANFYWHFQLEQAHLLGYSMGGRFALSFAVSYPKLVKGLILESASTGLPSGNEREARRKADNELADKIEKNGIEWFVDYWEQLPLWNSQTPEQKAYLREQRLKNDPLGLANSLRGMGTGVMPSLSHRLLDTFQDTKIPVKLIVGEMDAKFVEINREMAQLIPNADLSIVAGAGHTVHLEKPDEYAELVLQFLDKHS